MPTPSPSGNKKSFISNCMGDSVMNKEFPDEKQRAAVCYSKWAGGMVEKGTIEVDFFGESGGCPVCKCLPCICGS